MEDKFVGCLLGSLVGDCFGYPFELAPPVPDRVASFLKQRLTVEDPTKLPVLYYTDDTEMARSVAESLLVSAGFDALDIAKRFVKEYKDGGGVDRGYGLHVVAVFRKQKERGWDEDLYAPAAEQFSGMGSLGNGAAMRTHPVALFCHRMDQDAMFHICRQIARITHANIDGYNGAILQTLAVRQALNADPNQPLDVMDFLQRLRSVMCRLESRRPPSKFTSFCVQLDNIQSALKSENDNPSDLGRKLGTDETAPHSLPAAIYCFLRSQQPVEQFPTENPFLRTLYLCISLGGDTDTIACMACALSGAYHGKNYVPDILIHQCEDWTELLNLAQRLAAVS